MTKDELAKLMKEITERFGTKDPIIVRPDPNTSFATVFDLLQILTASGVKNIEIGVSSSDDGETVVSRYLTLSREQIVEERFASFRKGADKAAEKNRRDKAQKDTDSLLKTLRSAGAPPPPK